MHFIGNTCCHIQNQYVPKLLKVNPLTIIIIFPLKQIFQLSMLHETQLTYLTAVRIQRRWCAAGAVKDEWESTSWGVELMLWWMNSPVMKNWQPSGEKKSAAPVIAKWQPGDWKNDSPVIEKNGSPHALKALSLDPFKQPLSFQNTDWSLPKQQPLIPLKHGLISFENSSPESL